MYFRVQLGYIYHKQGRIREAHQLYTSNLKLKLEDIALAAVACNNAIIINKEQNVFDSKRKLKIATNEVLKFKLTLRQRKYIFLNRAMLNYYINQYDACTKVCDTIESMWPDLSIYVATIRALILVKAGNYDEALKLLTNCEIQNDEEQLQIQLISVQLWLMQVYQYRVHTWLSHLMKSGKESGTKLKPIIFTGPVLLGRQRSDNWAFMLV